MMLIATDVQLDEDLVKPGWIALLIVLALAVATFLLWRSMNTQIRRIQIPKSERPDRRTAYDRSGTAVTAAAAPIAREAEAAPDNGDRPTEDDDPGAERASTDGDQ